MGRRPPLQERVLGGISASTSRFSTYGQRKLDHYHWDSMGNLIWDVWKTKASREYEQFARVIRSEFNLPTAR